jgi:hypothetical protein
LHFTFWFGNCVCDIVKRVRSYYVLRVRITLNYLYVWITRSFRWRNTRWEYQDAAPRQLCFVHEKIVCLLLLCPTSTKLAIGRTESLINIYNIWLFCLRYSGFFFTGVFTFLVFLMLNIRTPFINSSLNKILLHNSVYMVCIIINFIYSR